MRYHAGGKTGMLQQILRPWFSAAKPLRIPPASGSAQGKTTLA
jgi:hypothetical protein